MTSSTALCIAGVRNSHAINGASENQCGPKSGTRFTIPTDSQNASIGLKHSRSSSFSTNERRCTECCCARIRMLWNMRTPPPWRCKTGGYGVATKICIFAGRRPLTIGQTRLYQKQSNRSQQLTCPDSATNSNQSGSRPEVEERFRIVRRSELDNVAQEKCCPTTEIPATRFDPRPRTESSNRALHKKYIVGAHRAPLQLRTQAVGAVYDRPGFFVQSPPTGQTRRRG